MSSPRATPAGTTPAGLQPRRRPAPRRRRASRRRDDVARGRRFAARARPAGRAAGHRPQRRPARPARATRCCCRPPRMRGVEIDPAARRARVGAGVRWADVADRGLRARPRRAARLLARRRRRRLLARRRHGLARPQARPAGQQRHRDRARHRRRPASCASTPTTSPTCSGRCAAAAATSASSPRSSSTSTPLRALRRRAVLPVRARRARCCTPGASGCPTSPTRSRRSGGCCSSRRSRTCPSFVRGRRSRRRGAPSSATRPTGAELLAPLRALGPEHGHVRAWSRRPRWATCTWTRTSRRPT